VIFTTKKTHLKLCILTWYAKLISEKRKFMAKISMLLLFLLFTINCSSI